MKTKLFLLVLLFLLSPIYAQTINIEPGIFDISMYGGEFIGRNLTITATGFETSILANVYTEIKANRTDSNGFEVIFSESQFVLNNNQPQIIQMEIYAVPNLEPDSFEIEVQVKTQIQKIETVSTGGRSRIIYIEYNKTNQTPTNITFCKNETLFVPYYINLTKEIQVERIVNQSVPFEDTSRIEELEKKVNNLCNGLIYAIGLILLLGSIVLYEATRKKKPIGYEQKENKDDKM